MRKIVLGIVGFILLLGLSIIGVAFSARGSMEEMRGQNLLFLITDGEVELAVGYEVNERKSFFVDPTEVSADPEELVGGEVTGIFGIGEEGAYERRIVIGRTVVIRVGVIEKMVDIIGGVDVASEEDAPVQFSTHLTGSQVADIIREESLGTSGSWKVSYLDPLTHNVVTKELEGSEFEDLLVEKRIVPEDGWKLKLAVLKWVAEDLLEKTEADEGLARRVLGALLSSYKKGEIATYPSNTLTRLAGMAPTGIIEKILLG
jgi:hypothetical protein